MKTYLALFLLFLVQPCLAQLAYDRVPQQPNPARAFVDLTSTFSSTEKAALEDTLQAFYFRTHNQLVVIAVESVKPYTMSDYALTIGRKWGIGNQGDKKGIVLLWAKTDRKVFIATAQGVEGPLPDALTDRIIHQTVLPAFKQGQCYEGLRDGSFQIISTLQREPVQPQLAASPKVNQPETSSLPALILAILIILGILVVWCLVGLCVFIIESRAKKNQLPAPMNGPESSPNQDSPYKVKTPGTFIARPAAGHKIDVYTPPSIYQAAADEPTLVSPAPVEEEPERKSDTSSQDSSSLSSSYSDQSFSYGSSSDDTFSGRGSEGSY